MPIVNTHARCPAGSFSHHRCAGLRTQRLDPADPSRGSRGPSPDTQRRSLEGDEMGKLEGKVAVITCGATGIGRAAANRHEREGYDLHHPEGAPADGPGRFDHPDRIERRRHGRPRVQRLQRQQGGRAQPRADLGGGPEGQTVAGESSSWRATTTLPQRRLVSWRKRSASRRSDSSVGKLTKIREYIDMQALAQALLMAASAPASRWPSAALGSDGCSAAIHPSHAARSNSQP